MNILSILILIGLVFGFILAELDGFNNEIIDLNIEIKLEKNGLNNDCDVSSSPSNNTIGVPYTPPFNFSPTGVGSAEFNNLGRKFNAVLAPTATATIATNENKNKNIFKSDPAPGHSAQTQHPPPPPNASKINRNDKNGQADVGFCEFDNIGCVSDNNIDGIGLQYEISFGMCIIFCLFCFSFVYDANEWSCFVFCFCFCFNTEGEFFLKINRF